MTDKKLDAVIIGQGLAGTTLAWALKLAGKEILILDKEAPVSSSKIAAGLITPITGKRLVLSRDYERFFSSAQEFYQKIEELMGVQLFRHRTARRFFQTDDEIDIWARRKKDPAYMPYICKSDLGAEQGFEMKAAQLDVAQYLAKSKEHLEVMRADINWKEDVVLKDDHVLIGEYTARYVISCEGIDVTRNPYFSWVKFNPAKGEILTVRFLEDVPDLTYHQNIWMAPSVEKNVFFVGSTYDWENLDMVPTAEAREDIEERLTSFTDVDYEVLDHKAAVRPIIFQSLALIGMHPEYSHLGFFNGLGSKGSLQAPLYAQDLTRHLFAGGSLKPEFDVVSAWPDEIK